MWSAFFEHLELPEIYRMTQKKLQGLGLFSAFNPLKLLKNVPKHTVFDFRRSHKGKFLSSDSSIWCA